MSDGHHGPTGALGLAGHLTRAFIASPLTPLLLLASLALGLIALVSLPREEEPQISVPLVDIHVQADGLRAEDAVKLVTEPLETIVKGIDQVEHVYSDTRDDRVMVTARFEVGTDADTAILRVRDRILANIDRIPVGIPEPLVVGRGINDVAIVGLTFSPVAGQASITAADLTRIAREVEVRLARIENVGLTYLIGATGEALRVAPDPERLALYGITLQQLAGKVQGANSAAPAGNLRDGGEQVGLVIGETLSTPEEIANLELTARDGRTVYVRDVAEVGFVSDLDEHHVATLHRGADGEVHRAPAVTLALAKRAGANAVLVAEEILHRVEEMQGREGLIPDSVAVEITRDYGETADEKANELLFHLALATVSIVALVLFAIGWREAVVVAIVIPLTILLTLFAAYIMGYTLNRVSLFALIFSIGILVDDAIVVIENIARHWAMKREGQSRFGAAVSAVAEVGNPTIVATLTVVVALLPMLFVSGLMGPYMSPIPANASAAMIFSFFVAVMITPWLMLKVAGRAPTHHEGEGGFPGGRLGRVYAAVARPLLAGKGRSALFLLAVVVLSFGSLGLFYTKDVTVKLLPFDNKSELSVVIDLPEGASVEDTDAVAQRAARVALELPEVHSAQTHAGTAAAFNFNGLVRHYYLREGPEMGEVQLNLAHKGERDRTSHDIALDLRERLAALEVPAGTVLKVVEPPPGPPVISTLLAEIYGPDAETRRAVAERVRGAFAEVPFVVDVDDSYGTRPRRLRAELQPSDLDFFRVSGGRRAGDAAPAQRRLDGGLFAPRRGTAAHPHRHGARAGGPGAGRAGALDPGAGQRFARRARRGRTGRRGSDHRGARLVPDLPAQWLRRHHGDRRVGRRLRGAALWHAGGRGPDRGDGLARGDAARDPSQRPAREHRASLAALGRRVGGHLGHLPRHGRGLCGGAAGDLHPRGGAVRQLPPAAGDPDAGAADLPGDHGGALALRGALLGDLDDRLHRAGGDHRAQLDPAGRFHPPRRPGPARDRRYPDRGGRHAVQADPADRAGGDDRGGGDPRRPDLPGAGDIAALRAAVLDRVDGSGDPGGLPAGQDMRPVRDPAFAGRARR
ncbi:Acriflavin resistance protein [Salipiger mucosus DSM 16094]|uniref:Acriflavin resistance protein n=1 Tax=Salipiger mucosus DSM 16094 TaxID=1123237 RepID=S9RXV9_9RHOB|nr:Acriflavin resistance protein [Salipiger mucosus DSM 16094]